MICTEFDKEELKNVKKEDIFRVLENVILNSVESRLEKIKNNLKFLENKVKNTKISLLKIIKSSKLCIYDNYLEIKLEKGTTHLEFEICFESEFLSNINNLIKITLTKQNDMGKLQFSCNLQTNDSKDKLSSDLLLIIQEEFPEIFN